MNVMTVAPRAITMWDFSWLERRCPGAGYEDWDKALGELKERNTEIAFRNFQTRGAFLVLAGKNTQTIYHLEILSRCGNTFRVMNPWPGKMVKVLNTKTNKPVDVNVDHSNGECLVFSTIAGQNYNSSSKLIPVLLFILVSSKSMKVKKT